MPGNQTLYSLFLYFIVSGSVERYENCSFVFCVPVPLIRLLGLCNNFAYVVMLSAAHDILEKQKSKNSTSASDKLTVDFRAGNSSNNSGYDCIPVTTGAVLLADILPTLIIKLFAPFVIHKVPYG
ncbi:hypothetical protein CHARACLAT_029826 [Characodon lateralis]|uniref:Battenin n=1 Tax=Characodon lateralis TaxID=208331 RepID=A0ABU7EYI2_9TELE|nr:hypothetical protein [Characodon lateralis]